MLRVLAVIAITCAGLVSGDGLRQLQTSDWDGPFDTEGVVAAGAANLPGGKVLLWSGQQDTYWGGNGSTVTVIWDPTNNRMTKKTINTNSHNMFCPGTTNMPDGRLMVTGGQDSGKTTFYDAARNQWTAGRDMEIDRGYQAQTMLANGDVFVLGGSWGVPNNERGDKDGELWSASSGRWRKLSGVPDDPFLTNDREGVYRSDNHMWLFLAPNNRIFHAGPSKRMHWITTSGNGSVQNSVTRGNDDDAMNGNAVMYDIGKILTIGGGENYASGGASNRAYVIDINGNEASVTQTGSMRTSRTLGNSAALPSGEVISIGGVDGARIFTDDGSVMAPEIWSPRTGRWTALQSMRVPRNYHSVALLLKDGRVMAAGGGLCRCGVNHPDVEILTPPYLYSSNGNLATRPVIRSSPTTTGAGQRFQVTMNTSGSHTFALMRLSSITHSTNNDMRRIPLSASRNGSVFTLSVPSNPSVALAGAYYLFAMNSAGVPSIGADIRISLDGGSSGSSSFTPNPNKTYYIEAPHHNLRLAADGDSDKPYTVSSSSTANDAKWKFVAKGNGNWHVRRARGGSKPGLRVSDGVADMQTSSSSGTKTYYEFTEGHIDGTVFFTLPDTSETNNRLQIIPNGQVRFVPASNNALEWESFRVVEV